MKVQFDKSFLKDLKKVSDKTLKQKLENIILELEAADDTYDVKEVKKLKGHPYAFRVRINDFRLGFYVFDEIVVIKRFVKRQDIYKLFS